MTIDDETLKIELKASEILKACRERGQKRAGGISLDEAIAELEALQHRNCEGCKHCIKVFSYVYPLCTGDEQYPFQIHNKEVLACRFHEAKEQ